MEKYQKREHVIIGSQAMKHHFPDFPRIPMDTDVVCTRKKFDETLTAGLIDGNVETLQQGSSKESAIIKWKDIPTPVEYLFSDGISSLDLILNNLCTDSDYATISVIYSLRKAHIHFPIKFNKHIGDFMFLRKKLREIKGISLIDDLNSVNDLLDEYPALTYTHFKETEKRLGKLRTPKMDQSTEEFFGKSKNYVKSYYIHDNMHLAMSHDEEKGVPTYIKILKDGSEVETDEWKWHELTTQEKIWAVLEEVYVIALERKILPQMFENNDLAVIFTPKQAFDWALYRVCTTLCDGFFRGFAVRAYDQIQEQYNPEYVNKFFNNISKYETTTTEED